MNRICALISCVAMALGLCAQTMDHTIEIGDFHEFTIVNSINIIYRHVPDSAGLATFRCSASDASAITFSNKDSKLRVEVIADAPIAQLPTVTIYSLALDKVTNWGDSTIVVEKVNPGAQFKAKVIGNGDIVANDIICTKADATVQAGNGHIFISGKCQEAKYNLMSSGTIEGGSMVANKVKSCITGTGTIDCIATETLKVTGIGSGTVYYKGNPKMTNRGIGIKAEQIID